MSPSRYEPVPQVEDVIDLRSYNYNTGVPNSPPPSFHTTESVLEAERCKTPRPDDSITVANNPSGPALWSNSNAGADAITTSREVLIVNLHKRVEKLEETIGRLLLEKDGHIPGTAGEHRPQRSNCCVTFAAADPSAVEHALLRGDSNCCVVVRTTKWKSDAKRIALVSVGLLIIIWVIVMSWPSRSYCMKIVRDEKQ